MDEFPGNSHGAKKSDQPTEAKNVDKVVVGAVVRRKKPLGARFAEMFVGGDAQSVMQYVLLEVLAPAAKDMIADAVSQGVERLIFGEARSTGRRTGARPSGSSGYVSYNNISRATVRPREEDARVPLSRRSRAAHDFEEIVLATRVEADEVITRMWDLLEKYELVTVNELYDLVGVSGNFTDDKWGWLSLRGAGVRRIREGYLLDLPKPVPIDA